MDRGAAALEWDVVRACLHSTVSPDTTASVVESVVDIAS